ncbi:Holliday junction resolvase RuvX [Stratiformator vulcanicus]|uniref:Putative pre-16S rRNA nuclease n=1 Tax=Stratiformator vulcanicus TaxID=2527980 RepID=A0A517R4Y2_9PLAN|nr:Holliday junction resolvase RuvX [Stratiformator vulcanicus]QDT38931.1 Putative Holliday junction resolvase [Stratiformator vulcanicus]
MSDEQEDAGTATDFPTEGRLLGIDYGTKRVGLAVTDWEQSMAVPLSTIQRSHERTETREYRTAVDDYSIKGLVLGLPVHISGNESGKSQEARRYGNWLADITGLPVTYWDERFTSAIAEEHLLAAGLTSKKRKQRIDKLAAQIMLQSFLDAKDREKEPGEY